MNKRIIMRVVEEIQTHNHDTADQLREVLIHKKYLSQEDINICLGFDLAAISNRPEINSIRTLHEALKSEYGSEDV